MVANKACPVCGHGDVDNGFGCDGFRGVLHCWATDKDDPAEDPKFGRMGKQRCENTGPLTRERMKTVDAEFLNAAENSIDRSAKEDKPFSFGSTPPGCTSGRTFPRSTSRRPWTKVAPKSMSTGPA
jgi:arylsulfatase A-like enzyme